MAGSTAHPHRDESTAPGTQSSLGGSSGFADFLQHVAQAPEPSFGALRSLTPPAVLESIGPYRIHEVIGRGGMGVVFRAEHRTTKRMVALKTVLAPRAELLQNIRREIHALARLQHPGIVKILDEGTVDGVPWYAMELLTGQTLRRFAGNAWRASPSGEDGVARLPSILSLIRGLCSPLAHLHGEGLVHRDLKPDNVLVQPDGTPVLVDFGLFAQFAGAMGREALQFETMPAGTARYMAPEQIRGDLVDARADLYALGCILFELVAGRPPFEGPSVDAILKLHLNQRPVAPSSLKASLPPELDELILSLLEKEPQSRLGYADAVAAAIARLEAPGGGDPREDRDVAPRARSYLYQPRFSGRAEPLAKLHRCLADLVGGQGRLVVIGGDSGVGKTRLATEFGRETARRGIRVLSGECLEAGAGPLEPLRRLLLALGDRCRERGLTETIRVFARHGKLLSRYEPLLASLPGFQEFPEPAELPAAPARLRLFDAMTFILDALAEDRALLLVLDDLQWADDLTLGWLDFLVRSGRLSRASVLIVATVRTEAIPSAAAALQATLESHMVERLDLQPLPESDVGTMVCDMLALQAAPKLFVSFLAEHSEGNPFFLAEYLRMAVTVGVLWRDPVGRWQIGQASDRAASESVYRGLTLPTSLRRLVSMRLEGLSSVGGRLVSAAATLGREAPAELVLAVAALSASDALDATDETLRRHVLSEPEAGRLRFAHDRIREVAYEGIGTEQRSGLHRSAAEAIEGRFSSQRDQFVADLGRHWELCGETARARVCYLEAARRAVAGYAHEEAERHFRAYQRLVPAPSVESVAVRIELGESVLKHRGRNREASEEHLLALEEASTLGEKSAQLRALQGLGRIQCATGRLEEARGRLGEALSLARDLKDRRAEGSVLGNLATLDWIEGRWSAAEARWSQSLAMAREIGDRKGEAYALNNLALVHKGRNELNEGLALYHQVLPILREIGDRSGQASALGNIGLFHQRAGRDGEARRFYEEALAIAREVGSRDTEAHLLFSLTEIRIDSAQLADARRLGAEALEILQELGDRRFEGLVLVRLAGLERHAGAQEAGERLAQRAETLLTEVGDRVNVGHCLCQQGHLELAAGRPARDRLEQVLAHVAALDAECQRGLAKSIGALTRAVEAFEAGQPLLHGECPQDVTEALRKQSTPAG